MFEISGLVAARFIAAGLSEFAEFADSPVRRSDEQATMTELRLHLAEGQLPIEQSAERRFLQNQTAGRMMD